MTSEAWVRDWGGRQAGSGYDVGAARFTRARVERIIALVAGFGCSVLGAQGFVNALTSDIEGIGWRVALSIAVFAPLVLMIVACFVGRWVAATARVFAVAYPLALVMWPTATGGAGAATDGAPWIWYLINVATSAAVLGFPLPVQIGYAALIPALYGLVRLQQLGFAAVAVLPTILDVVFAVILAAVILTLGWMLRSVAASMDGARAEAVRSYAAAAAADAAEDERVAVAALMHDSVLAALIAAERAQTPREHTLAVSMAREALTRLANADQDSGEGSDDPVIVGQLGDGLQRAAIDLGVDTPVDREIDDDAVTVPGRVARALVLAGIQAIANAQQHARARGLRIGFEVRRARVSITVSDTGTGFDPERVPEDRLGIRGSMVARMAAVGGTAIVRSSPAGTVVSLVWGGAS
ncbi:sensor histidine kinase [Microbacterium sp.]|uniref:sensor histidine kinase n=1 Tax=Microbacterium sp. TaxID=51671 RepID=UPI003A8C73B1